MDRYLQFNPSINTKFFALYDTKVWMIERQHRLDDIAIGLRTL